MIDFRAQDCREYHPRILPDGSIDVADDELLALKMSLWLATNLDDSTAELGNGGSK